MVAIGASAGGLETYSEFLKALPTDLGMAFVLVQHLDPTRHSLLVDIIAKATRMPVFPTTARSSEGAAGENLRAVCHDETRQKALGSDSGSREIWFTNRTVRSGSAAVLSSDETGHLCFSSACFANSLKHWFQQAQAEPKNAAHSILRKPVLLLLQHFQNR